MAIGISKITPPIIKRWRDSLIFLIGGSLSFTQILAPKFNIAAEEFGMWCGFSILIVHFGAKLFGLDDEVALEQLQNKIDQIKKKQEDKDQG